MGYSSRIGGETGCKIKNMCDDVIKVISEVIRSGDDTDADAGHDRNDPLFGEPNSFVSEQPIRYLDKTC